MGVTAGCLVQATIEPICFNFDDLKKNHTMQLLHSYSDLVNINGIDFSTTLKLMPCWLFLADIN